MLSDFYTFVEDAIAYFSREENYESVMIAQARYEELVGKISRDAENYDRRMTSFYEWFLFDYQKCDSDKKHIDVFLEMKGGSEEFKAIIDTITFSLFEYLENSFFKHNVYRNHISGEKFSLIKEHRDLLFIKDDLILGYSGKIGEDVFFLDGLFSLCRHARKIILKEHKKVKKMQNKQCTRSYLYQVELLDLRYKHYRHVGPEKIFKFSYEQE